MALDKCLPKRRFLQIVDIPHDENSKINLEYDLEWLTVLFLTNHLLSVKSSNNYLPGPNGSERWVFTPTENETNFIRSKFENLSIPENFIKTAAGHADGVLSTNRSKIMQPVAQLNPQTTSFCAKLGIDDPMELILKNALEQSLTLDDSSLEESYSQTTIEDSDLSVKLESMNASIRPRLSLPEPKSDSYGDSLCEVSHAEDKQEVNGSQQDNVDCNSKANNLPRPKKFIRRNADIYNEENSA